MLQTIAKVSKAIAGAASAGSAAAATALAGDGAITAGEWVVVAIALVTGFVITYGAPANRTE